MSDEPNERGACSCGWRGPWRTSDDAVQQDIREHCAATGSCEPGVAAVEDPADDELMPHERRKKSAPSNDVSDPSNDG